MECGVDVVRGYFRALEGDWKSEVGKRRVAGSGTEWMALVWSRRGAILADPGVPDVLSWLARSLCILPRLFRAACLKRPRRTVMLSFSGKLCRKVWCHANCDSSNESRVLPTGIADRRSRSLASEEKTPTYRGVLLRADRQRECFRVRNLALDSGSELLRTSALRRCAARQPC